MLSVIKRISLRFCRLLNSVTDRALNSVVIVVFTSCEGFVLKKDQKKENAEEEISLEDLIEREVLSYLCLPLMLFTWPMWVQGHCRINPPHFLAKCCKSWLNQGSFVLLYFRLSALFDLYWVSVCLFSCTSLFVSISQVIGCEDRLPKWPILCRVGR